MEIKEIKSRLTIHTVLNHYHLKADRGNMLRCPFHEEETASMRIYPDTNSFHCFGCGKSGDAIEFCCLKEGDKHKGILKSAELCSGLQPINSRPVKSSTQLKENDPGILTRIFESFTNGLHSPISKRPKEYLQARNLDYELLEMGYNSGQYHHGGKLSEGEIKDWLSAGMLIPYKGSVPNGSGRTYTCFAKDCIIFPIKSAEGRIVSLYGRGIKENRDGSGKHFYLKNRRGLYPGYPDPGAKRLILTEAIIDAATLLQLPEITNQYEILACYGTNGFTHEHQEAIRGLTGLEEITFFFDGDKTGREAMQKYQGELSGLLPEVKLTGIETPEGEDVNSLSVAHSAEIFTHLLETRKSFLLTETGLTEKEQDGDQSMPQDPAVPAGIFNTRNPEFITFTTGDLKMVILGGVNLQQLDRLRLTIKISRSDMTDPLHSIRHTLDLYHSDYLEKFIQKASEQLEASSNTIRRALAELTERIEQYRISRIESLKEEKPQSRQLTEQRKVKAISYLKSDNLMERTGRDISGTGIVGEKNNSLLMYLVFTSRLRDQPLHVISLGSSGTGKTYLQEKIAELIPEQDKLEITILSENAFYYFDRKELKNKLVLIEDMDGAEQVLYPLRELQTKRKISKTIPIKDSKGNLKTITLRVEGPICLAGTTTRERLYEDNANRSLLIYLDGSREHKEQIMEYQRKLSAGRIDTRKENELKELFKDMQTLLKPIPVRNTYAEYLKLPEYVFKPLRTNAHYLAVIETITFYHQWQREVKTDPESGERYIETSLEDIRWANHLLRDVLLAKSDELSKAERSFFESLKKWLVANSKENFYAKQVREAFRMHPSKVKRYLYSLTTYGLVKITGGNRFKTGFEYEVAAMDEYHNLESSVSSVLDEVLEDLKQKTSGPGGLQVVYGQNRPLNSKETSKIRAVVQ
ncbi:MAG: toprim domain-containing protein [Bacteroidales bacterium]|nr:toprim domain-containing protein [Bacteroidales bacterium]